MASHFTSLRLSFSGQNEESTKSTFLKNVVQRKLVLQKINRDYMSEELEIKNIWGKSAYYHLPLKHQDVH